MSLPNTNGVLIHKGYNCSPNVVPTAQSIQMSTSDTTTVNSAVSNKMDKVNPEGTGSLSLNRKSGTTTGSNSVTEGSNNTASGTASHAEGTTTIASGARSHTEGESTQATGDGSHAEGLSTVASGSRSHAEGALTIANRRSQHVFGEFNVADTGGAGNPPETGKGTYVEIVGNGTSDTSRSNARTLDWSGNEVLAGDLTINGNVSVGNAITPYYYNANTDRNTESNRTNAIIYLIDNAFRLGCFRAVVRYTSGYYHSYIAFGPYGAQDYYNILETTHALSSNEKLILWTGTSSALYKLWSVS